MATNRVRGATPFERLRSRFDESDLTCPGCGYEDEDGSWQVETDGRRVRYRHVCSRCGKQRTLRYTVTG